MIKEFGFLEDVITEEDYILGANLPLEVINESQNWEEWLPVFEHQASRFETAGCTAFATLNQIECYMKKVFDFEPNYSDRFIYNVAKIIPPGAPPSRAYEAIRKKGVIDEGLLPYNNSLEEYSEPRPMLSGYIRNGKDWLSKYEFKHEWITNPNPAKIKEALKYSPVALSVTAWMEENGLYVDYGQRNTHWTLAYKVEDDKIHIFDSYEGRKILHPDHNTKFAKRIRIVKRNKPLVIKRYSWLGWYNLLRIYKLGKHANK